MDTTDYIQEIRERATREELFQRVYGLYQNKAASSHDISEQEYADAHTALSNILTRQQSESLSAAERTSLAAAKWLTGFGFSRGIYAAFQQYFTKVRLSKPFKTLVIDQVLKEPNMQHYPVYYDMRQKMLKSYEWATTDLNKDGREMVANIEMTWQDRFLGVLRHSFYLGYRSALSCIDETIPFGGSFSITNQILHTEHELGFTHTIAEREQRARQEANALENPSNAAS